MPSGQALKNKEIIQSVPVLHVKVRKHLWGEDEARKYVHRLDPYNIFQKIVCVCVGGGGGGGGGGYQGFVGLF